jgi:NDP-sugar pyrophosphorylase family protein
MNRSSIQLVIPAAGNGIRFKQAGYSKIKPLIEVHGIPMINWVIANFDLNENDRVFIIVKNGDRIEELRENWFKVSNLKLNFIVLNGITEGPADSVNKVRKLIDGKKPMIVANSVILVLSLVMLFFKLTFKK